MAHCDPRTVSTRYTVCILLLLANSCFSASLDCRDSENSAQKLACQLDIPYEEIADAFNLNCQPSDHGLVCKFETLRGDSAIAPSTTNIVVSDAAKINECSSNNDDHGGAVCLHSEIKTKLERKLSSREAVPEQRGQKEENVPSVEDEMRGENSSNAGDEPLDFSIKIGNCRVFTFKDNY